jgi:hypothetical protein
MSDHPTDCSVDGRPVEPPVDPAEGVAVRGVVLEIERHVGEAGWDQPARLFALVRTAELLADEPGLASMLEVEPGADLTGSLTPVEQDELPEVPLEELLTQIAWPAEVHGTAVVVERLVLPPSVGVLPEDPVAAQELAVSHPERQEVRMVAAATRGGTAYCALRLRTPSGQQSGSSDLQGSTDRPGEPSERGELIEGPELVPALLELLRATLDAPEQ